MKETTAADDDCFNLFREHIIIPIHWHLGNLKNTHVGDHRSVPRQSYIRALMYYHSDVWIYHKASHTSELRCTLVIHKSDHTLGLRCSAMHSDEYV